MSNQSINFISAQTQKKLVVISRLKDVRKGLIGILALCLVGYCVVTVMRITRQYSLSGLDKQVLLAESQVDENRKTESLIRTVKSRVELINTLGLSSQGSVSRSLELIGKLVEEGFLPKDNLKLGTASELSVETEAGNTAALSDIISIMDSLKSQKYFIGYRVNSIQRQTSGGYRLSIDLY